MYEEYWKLKEKPFKNTPDPSLRPSAGPKYSVGMRCPCSGLSSLRGNPYGFPLIFPFLPQEAICADSGKILFPLKPLLWIRQRRDR